MKPYQRRNMRDIIKIISGCLIIVIFMVGVVFFLNKYFLLNPYRTALLVSEDCPQSAEMNYRFQMLYLKYGGDKKIPHNFQPGELFSWQDIYENIDYLLQDPDLSTATGTIIKTGFPDKDEQIKKLRQALIEIERMSSKGK